MKRILILACAVALVGTGSSMLPAEYRGDADYYPLKPGTKWDYRIDVAGKVVQLSNTIEKKENINGEELAIQKTIANGVVAATEYLSTNREGIFRHKTIANNMNNETKPPICLLKYPVKPGQTWEGEHQTGAEKAKVSVKVNDFQEVQVPAGKYKAISVTLNTVSGGKNVTTTYWFAANVGVVKQTAMIGTLNLTMELEKFEAGK